MTAQHKDSTMTDSSRNTASSLVKPKQFATQKHKWSPPICVFGDKTSTGCEQSERVCVHCDLVRITVHPPQGFPWREWRNPNSRIQYLHDGTPPCIARQ